MIEPIVVVTAEVNGISEKAICGTIGQNRPAENSDHYNPSVREVNIPKLANGSCGFDLSRSKWDPYPWVCNDSNIYEIIIEMSICIM